jgi:hypothetical protein
MNTILSQLTQIRKQLVTQQSSINECLTVIDSLIMNQINGNSNTSNGFQIPDDHPKFKTFPKNIFSKRDKLRYILSQATEPMAAKEIKSELLEYGEDLPNVDQSLVNLEKDKVISSKLENGRKQYFMKKKS